MFSGQGLAFRVQGLGLLHAPPPKMRLRRTAGRGPVPGSRFPTKPKRTPLEAQQGLFDILVRQAVLRGACGPYTKAFLSFVLEAWFSAPASPSPSLFTRNLSIILRGGGVDELSSYESRETHEAAYPLRVDGWRVAASWVPGSRSNSNCSGGV